MSHYYFAYGSNLNPEQMEERCPQAEPVGPGLLDGYRLAFGGHSPHWEGSPATIVPDDEARVPGLVYAIPLAEIRVLDHYEGHPIRYKRRELTIVGRGEQQDWSAHVYIKEVDDDFDAPPPDYLEVLRDAYARLDFELERLERAVALGQPDDASDGAG